MRKGGEGFDVKVRVAWQKSFAENTEGAGAGMIITGARVIFPSGRPRSKNDRDVLAGPDSATRVVASSGPSGT